ncbi:MAG: Fic family protein [Bacteroidetes bacterium]|nr:MAG: Fic family protein [Bacteroidota bacterium]
MNSQFEEINETFKKSAIQDVFDFERVFSYISAFHSTAIEGSTLTQTDTAIFLENQIPIKGKPMLHHDMVRDYHNAYLFLKNYSQNQNAKILTIDFIQEINKKVMKNTGSIINYILGTIDTGNGEIRNFAVRAASGGYYMTHDKVPDAMAKFILTLNLAIGNAKTSIEKHHIAFEAHYNLVTIHPFGDGNGRTSRLLMNYIQMLFKEPLSIVYAEDKEEYIKALIETREKKDIKVFKTFMENQHTKLLIKELELLKSNQTKSKIDNSNNKGMAFFF